MVAFLLLFLWHILLPCFFPFLGFMRVFTTRESSLEPVFSTAIRTIFQFCHIVLAPEP